MPIGHLPSNLTTDDARLCETEPLRRLVQAHALGAEAVDDESRLVTRDERHEGQIAHIDWFACTFRREGADIANIIEFLFLVPSTTWRHRLGGWQGYEKRIDLGDFGLVAFDGIHQRDTVHLELNAHGCSQILDWQAVREWCEACGVRITRIDLAHDDFSGSFLTIAQARAWFHEGQFTTGGRAPIARLVDDLGSGKGKTLYIGQRQSGKLCRVYEKGRQLGDPDSPWCRVEVEFRGKSREIPHDVLARPSDYLAGAYPCLAHLSQHQDKMKTLRTASEIGYAQMIKCLRMQYGPALNVMLRVEAGDSSAVLGQVMRPGIPKRLANLPLPRGESAQDNNL